MPRAKRNISATGKLPVWTDITVDKMNSKKGKSYQRLLWEAQDYVHYEIKSASLAKAFIKYCGDQGYPKEDIAMVARLPDGYLHTPGKWAYIAVKGGELSEQIHTSLATLFQDLLSTACSKYQEEQQAKQLEQQKAAKRRTVSVQTRMQQQLDKLYSEFESAVDAVTVGELKAADYDAFNKIRAYEVDVKAPHAKLLRDYFEKLLVEAEAVVQFKDEQVKEGYGHIPVRRRKEVVKLLSGIIAACDTVINTKAAARKPRKKKAPSVEKLVKGIKYMQADPDLGLASVQPAKIVGAKTVWVYNTKSRKLGVYRADEMHKSLSVKGASIINFDAETSVQKTVRKPQDVMKGANKLARTKMDKLFNSLTTTDTKINGRMNEHTIIVSVF